MSTTIANLQAGSNVIGALGTYQLTAGTTATHICSIRLNIVPTSSVVVQIKQNSSVIATSSTPATNQDVIELKCNIAATAGDTISWVLTSSAPIDNQINGSLKGIINAHIGVNN